MPLSCGAQAAGRLSLFPSKSIVQYCRLFFSLRLSYFVLYTTRLDAEQRSLPPSVGVVASLFLHVAPVSSWKIVRFVLCGRS